MPGAVAVLVGSAAGLAGSLAAANQTRVAARGSAARGAGLGALARRAHVALAAVVGVGAASVAAAYLAARAAALAARLVFGARRGAPGARTVYASLPRRAYRAATPAVVFVGLHVHALRGAAGQTVAAGGVASASVAAASSGAILRSDVFSYQGLGFWVELLFWYAVGRHLFP